MRDLSQRLDQMSDRTSFLGDRSSPVEVDERCPGCRVPVRGSWLVCAECGERLASATELPAGATLAGGRFLVRRVLGRGGFGITYEVDDRRLERLVAVKELFPETAVRHGRAVLTPPGDREAFRAARDRFLREARVLARFDHPGIVRVHEVFEEHDTAYLVLELVQGTSLADVLRQRERALSEDEVRRLAGRIGGALAAVHAAGMLHRDLSPSNLLLTDQGRIVLIDFGLARTFADDRSSPLTRIVTPGYAPPEQYHGTGRLGPPTDVYGLAATLYRLLTRRVPPPAAERERGVAVEAPERVDPAISKLTSDAILDGLELDPAHRPQTVEDFLARLGLGRTRLGEDGPPLVLSPGGPGPADDEPTIGVGPPVAGAAAAALAAGVAPPLTADGTTIGLPPRAADGAAAAAGAPAFTDDEPTIGLPPRAPGEAAAGAPPTAGDHDLRFTDEEPTQGVMVPSSSSSSSSSPGADALTDGAGAPAARAAEPTGGVTAPSPAADAPTVGVGVGVGASGLGARPPAAGAAAEAVVGRPGVMPRPPGAWPPLPVSAAAEAVTGGQQVRGPAWPPPPVAGPVGWPGSVPAVERPAGRWKVTAPITVALAALASAAPVAVIVVLVVVLLPALATHGDVAVHRHRRRTGMAAGRLQRAPTPAVAPVRFVRNLVVSGGRAVPPLVLFGVLLGGWYLLDALNASVVLGQLLLRVAGVAVALMLLLPAREGSPGFRTGVGADDLTARLLGPGGAPTQRTWVLWIVAVAVIAGGLFLTPEPWPLPG